MDAHLSDTAPQLLYWETRTTPQAIPTVYSCPITHALISQPAVAPSGARYNKLNVDSSLKQQKPTSVATIRGPSAPPGGNARLRPRSASPLTRAYVFGDSLRSWCLGCLLRRLIPLHRRHI